MAQERSDILNGWKEIAGYLGRDLRTVERWEKQRGLPVRRVPGSGRATVYAMRTELDVWFKSGTLKEADGPAPREAVAADGLSPEAANVRSGQHAATAPAAAAPDPATPTAASHPPAPTAPRPDAAAITERQSRRTLIFWLAGALAGACCLLAVYLPLTHRGGADAATHAGYARSVSGRPLPLSRDAQVNDLVMRGRYAYEQRTPQSLRLAEECFTRAIARDPGYAPAYAGLGDTYLLLREYSAMPDEQAYPKALAAAQRAVQLDPAQPEAHTALGFIDFFWLGRPEPAEHEFKTALTLDPALVAAHHWYGSVLTHEGRFRQAVEELEQAQRLAPNSAAILSTRALAIGASGRRTEAVALLREAITEGPDASSPHQVLAILALRLPRQMREHFNELTTFATMRHDAELLRSTNELAAAYARGGEPAVWRMLLDREERAHPAPAPRTERMASLEFALGRNDDAFRDLETAVRQQERSLVLIQMDPCIPPEMHTDPRYRRVLAEIGLLPLLRPGDGLPGAPAQP